MNDRAPVRTRPAGLRTAWRRGADLVRFALTVLWLGGLTFYAGVVVPIGAQVTDGTTQGFVTQRVTVWLNVLGTAYIVATAHDAWLAPRRSRQALWLTLAAAQLALWILHPLLGRMLDPSTLSIVGDADFYSWHRLYLAATTVQWVAGVGHAFAVRRRSSIRRIRPPSAPSRQ